jgi:uncharacterized membrane protein
MRTITITNPIDILLCLLYSVIIIPFIFIDINNVIRMILGVPFLLFIPGYLFLLCITPNHSKPSEIDFIHKIGMSIGLSIALVALNGIFLFYTPFGFHLESIVSSLIILVILLGIIALYRWRKTRQQKQIIITFNTFSFKSKSRLDQFLLILLIFAVTLTITTAGFISLLPIKQETFTEFYILGESGKTTSYPKTLTIGENANVKLGLINHEHKTVDYTIEIWLVNQTITYNNSTQELDPIYHEMWFLDKLMITLPHFTSDKDILWQPQWEYLYTFNYNQTGQYTLMFLLFTSPAPDYDRLHNYQDIAATEIQNAYANLYIWLNITD